MAHLVANARLKVAKDEWIEFGEPCPEAANWGSLGTLIRRGAIVRVEGEAPPPDPPVPSPPVVGGLRVALAECREDPDAHTITELRDMAVAEDLDVPEKMPRTKAGVVDLLAEILGPEV